MKRNIPELISEYRNTTDRLKEMLHNLTEVEKVIVTHTYEGYRHPAFPEEAELTILSLVENITGFKKLKLYHVDTESLRFQGLIHRLNGDIVRLDDAQVKILENHPMFLGVMQSKNCTTIWCNSEINFLKY